MVSLLYNVLHRQSKVYSLFRHQTQLETCTSTTTTNPLKSPSAAQILLISSDTVANAEPKKAAEIGLAAEELEH